MTTLNSRLQLALLNRKKGRNLLEKGFTLVELMIVIVIVGILSSIALPSFLSQSVKAKGTEAKSDVAAIIKNAAAEFAGQGGTYVGTLIGTDNSATSCDGIGGRAAGSTLKFDYTCSITGDVLTVTATGDTNDTSIQGMKIIQTADLGTGVVSLDKANTCQVFGGSKTDGYCA